MMLLAFLFMFLISPPCWSESGEPDPEAVISDEQEPNEDEASAVEDGAELMPTPPGEVSQGAHGVESSIQPVTSAEGTAGESVQTPTPLEEPLSPERLQQPSVSELDAISASSLEEDDDQELFSERPLVELRTADGRSSIRFQLAVQLQYSFESIDRGPDADRENVDSVFFRRIRPVLSGRLLTDALSYRLHLNLVPGALELMDLWINYRFHSQAQVLVGQNKVPFTRYRLNSFQDLPTLIDWSNPTRYFGAERQIGLMVHNGVENPPQWEYQIGVYTGDNSRASNGVGLPRIYGERPENPSDLTDPALPSGFHPEIVLHLGYNHPEMNVRRSSDLEGGPIRYSVGLSAAYDIRPTPTEDFLLRFAPEVLIKAYGFMIQGVFYMAFWEDLLGEGDIGLASVATMIETSYVIRQRVEIAARYTLVHLTDDILADARARADGLIAGAVDDEAAALTAQYASVGRVQREHDVTVGFNIYVVSNTFKIQIDGSALGHERDDGTRWDFRVRTQAQLAF